MKPDSKSAKGIGTAKPVIPTTPVTPYRPTKPAINAGNVEYDADKVLEVLTNLEKLAEEKPAKEKKTKESKPERNIARNIVAKAFPSIKALLDKNYTKKEIYEIFEQQGIKINFSGFSNAIKKQIKALEAAEAAKKIELELEEAAKNDASPELTGMNVPAPNQEELDSAERTAEDFKTA